jgi:hypothetical protein
VLAQHRQQLQKRGENKIFRWKQARKGKVKVNTKNRPRATGAQGHGGYKKPEGWWSPGKIRGKLSLFLKT